MEPIEPISLTITVCPEPGGRTRLQLTGQLGASGVQQVESALADIPVGRGMRIDMSRVDFVDWAGLTMILRALARNPQLRLSAPSPAVRRAIDMLGAAAVLRTPDNPPWDQPSW